MGVAAPVRMAVASADPARTHVEEGHVRGRVDISGRSALHRGVARLTQQFVEPQVVVDADAQYCLRLAHAHEILRARLEALAILSCGDEVRCVDEIATDLGRERVQLRGRRDEVEARLREGGAREERRGQESEEGADQLRQRLFGITQCTFFSAPVMSPMRQSIAALARP